MVAGRVEWYDGGAVLGPLQVHAILSPVEWRAATLGPDGHFQISGLATGATTVRVNAGWDWPDSSGSPPAEVSLTLEAGREDVLVRLKRRDDPRDVGDHDAELHGRCVDATTGEVLPVGPYGVHAWPVSLPAGRDVVQDVLPNLLHVPAVQRALIHEPRATRTFDLVGLTAGQYLLLAELEGYGLAYAGPFTLDARAVVSGVEIQVARSAQVEVLVTDTRGAPVPGAWVFLTGEGGHSRERVAAVSEGYAAIDGRGTFTEAGGRRTDATGRTTLGRLPHGVRALVAAAHPDHDPGTSTPLVTRAGETLEARVTLARSH